MKTKKEEKGSLTMSFYWGNRNTGRLMVSFKVTAQYVTGSGAESRSFVENWIFDEKMHFLKLGNFHLTSARSTFQRRWEPGGREKRSLNSHQFLSGLILALNSVAC